MVLFTEEGFMFLFRWMHFIFGVIWIGMLYYFNFVQGAYFAETDAASKSNAIQKLVPRALWWFRYGALFTVITGLTIIGYKSATLPGIMHTSWGLSITLGMLMGIIMASNVWFVIWPAQQVVIASATQAAKGGAAIPEAAARGARAGVASRTNTLLSLPMLFFMGAASHLTFPVGPSTNLMPVYLAAVVILGAIEFNALKGKTGPMTSVKGVIHCGVALAIVFYFLVEGLLRVGG